MRHRLHDSHGKCSMVDISQIVRPERMDGGIREGVSPVWRSFADLREKMRLTLFEFAVSWSASVLELLLNEIWLNNTRHLTNDYADWMREASDLNLNAHVRTAFENVDAESDVRKKLVDIVGHWWQQECGYRAMPSELRLSLVAFAERLPTVELTKSAILDAYADYKRSSPILRFVANRGSLYGHKSFSTALRNHCEYVFQDEVRHCLESAICDLIGRIERSLSRENFGRNVGEKTCGLPVDPVTIAKRPGIELESQMS